MDHCQNFRITKRLRGIGREGLDGRWSSRGMLWLRSSRLYSGISSHRYDYPAGGALDLGSTESGGRPIKVSLAALQLGLSNTRFEGEGPSTRMPRVTGHGSSEVSQASKRAIRGDESETEILGLKKSYKVIALNERRQRHEKVCAAFGEQI